MYLTWVGSFSKFSPYTFSFIYLNSLGRLSEFSLQSLRMMHLAFGRFHKFCLHTFSLMYLTSASTLLISSTYCFVLYLEGLPGGITTRPRGKGLFKYLIDLQSFASTPLAWCTWIQFVDFQNLNLHTFRLKYLAFLGKISMFCLHTLSLMYWAFGRLFNVFPPRF